MNRVCAAMLGLATLAGPGCVSAPPAGTSLSAPAERSAAEAWGRARAVPGANRGDIYGSGFRAGFVAATGGGGTTTPDDWRAGFRHGAAAAFEDAAREPKARSTAALPLPAFPTAAPERPQTFSPAPKSFFVSEPVPPAGAARTDPPAPVPPAPGTGSNTSDRSAPAPKVALAHSQDRPEPTRPPVVVVEAVSAAPAEEFGPWRPAKPLPPSVVRDP